MNWIVWALLPPLIWSLLNHLDKYLISKYSHHVGIGGLAIMSSLFAFLSLPIIYFVDSNVFDINFQDTLIITLTGSLIALGVLFYLHALDNDDTSLVVPFWFLIPIFSYIFGVFILNEQLEISKIIGSLIVLIGAIVLSIDIDQKFKIKKLTPILMISSSVFLALSNVVFKSMSIEYSYWQSMFWNQFGIFLFAVILFTFVEKYRHDFFTVLRINNLELGVMNVIGEVLQIIASFISYYSILITQVSLVLLIGYTAQPLFVFIFGILLSTLFPWIAKEKIGHRHLIQKLIAIVIMMGGVYNIVL